MKKAFSQDANQVDFFAKTRKFLFAATSAVILKTETEHHHLSSLSGDNILGTGVRIGRGEDAVASGSSSSSTIPVMDSTQSAMMKQADYVVGPWQNSRNSLSINTTRVIVAHFRSRRKTSIVIDLFALITHYLRVVFVFLFAKTTHKFLFCFDLVVVIGHICNENDN